MKIQQVLIYTQTGNASRVYLGPATGSSAAAVQSACATLANYLVNPSDGPSIQVVSFEGDTLPQLGAALIASSDVFVAQ